MSVVEQPLRFLVVVGVGRTRIYVDDDGTPANEEVHTLSLMISHTGEVFEIPVAAEVAQYTDTILSELVEAPESPVLEETPAVDPKQGI